MVKNKLKILHVDIEGGYGGSSRSLFELTRTLKNYQNNHKVMMRKNGPVADKYQDQGIECEIYEKIFSPG